MSRLKIIFFLLFFSSINLASSLEEIEFLVDFFANRNVYINLCTNWNFAKIKGLLADKNGKLKQIGIDRSNNGCFRNFPLKENNFLVLDAQNLLKNLQNNTFSHFLKYLLIINQSESEEVLNLFESRAIYPSSDIFVAEMHEHFINIYQPYKILNNSNLIKRRSDFRRQPFNVGCVVIFNGSVNHSHDFRHLQVDSYFKIDYPSVHSLIEYLNISHTLRLFERFGYLNKTTGQWDGVVEDLRQGHSHISGNSVFFTLERYTVVDFLKHVGPLDNHFLLKKPSTSYIKNIYFITFTKGVWLATIAAMLISAVILYVLLNWETKRIKYLKQDRYSVSDATLVTFEALCQQGTYTEPSSFSGKLLNFVIFSAFMFVYVSYSAHIVVLLQSSQKINTIGELLQSRIEVGGLKINYMRIYFEEAKTQDLKDLYRKKIYPNQYFHLEEGLKKVQEGNFAFHVELAKAYDYILATYTNYDICSLQELPGYMNYRGYIAVPKQSPYRKFFMVGLLWIHEVGLEQRTINRVFMKPRCYSQGGKFQTVRMYDCYQLFIIWMVGCFLSLAILVGEILVAKWGKNGG